MSHAGGFWSRASCGGLLLTLSAAVWAQLPDLRRGEKAATEGDFAAAEADLLPLAEAGYTQAAHALAKLYAQMGTPQAIQNAIHWYRVVMVEDPTVAVPLAHALMRTGDPAVLKEAEASLRRADQNGDPRALAALIDFFTDHPQFQKPGDVEKMVKRAEKLDTPETEGVVIRWYRHKVRGGANEHQAALVKRCEKARERQPECYVDLARHYRTVGAQKPLAELGAAALRHSERSTMPGRLLERFAWSLVQDDYGGQGQPGLAYKILKRSHQGTAQSQVRLARLLVEYPNLDPSADPEELLRAALAQGSSEAAYVLGRLYLNGGSRVVADWKVAEKFFLKAAPSEPNAHFYLGRIYKRGALGRDDPVRAAQHYLTAARAGYGRADLALAQLFSDAHGAKVNRVYAYVFARIAADAGVPRAPELFAQLKASMSVQELGRAQKLWREELATRQGMQVTAAGEAAAQNAQAQ